MPKRANSSTLFSLFAVVIIDLIGFGIVIPILPFFAEEMGASASVLGLLFTSYAGMQFLFAPVWGRLSDRVGRRPVMLVTIAGTAVTLAVLGAAGSLAWLFAARILGGLFAANISVASAYITDATDEADRARYMGLLGACFAIGFILGPAIGGGLAPYGYHVPLFFAAALAALNFIFACFTLREHPDHKARDAKRLPSRLSPAVARLCLSYFIFIIGISQLETVFAFFMLDRFDWDARRVAMILVMMGVLSALIQGGAIRPLVRLLGERKMLLIGAALLAPSMAAVPMATTIGMLLIPLAVSAMARGLVQPALLSMVSVAAPEDERGGVMGAFQSSASLARMLGPLFAGVLYDLAAPWPFWLAGLLMLVVLGLGFAFKTP